MSSKPVVIRGKLKLKGFNTSSTKKTSNSVPSNELLSRDEKNTDNQSSAAASNTIKSTEESNPHLTEAQRKFLKRKTELELQTIKKLSSTTYRDRVENFNQKLSTMTEHNDIPRISAAGNG